MAVRLAGQKVQLIEIPLNIADTTHSQLVAEEHQMIYVYVTCCEFADEELVPNAGKWDQEHGCPSDAISQLVSLKK